MGLVGQTRFKDKYYEWMMTLLHINLYGNKINIIETSCVHTIFYVYREMCGLEQLVHHYSMAPYRLRCFESTPYLGDLGKRML